MNHFNIFNQNDKIIGDGFLTNDEKKININVLKYGDRQYGEMVGNFNKGGFSINFKSGEQVFNANNINPQSFNISDIKNKYVGMARFSNSINL